MSVPHRTAPSLQTATVEAEEEIKPARKKSTRRRNSEAA
jgi:hypothetical protein